MIHLLVNRMAKMERLEALLKRRAASLVLLHGGSRVGKTRLIHEFMKGKEELRFFMANAEERTTPPACEGAA